MRRAFEKTQEVWPEFSAEQKAGALTAGALTTARAAASIPALLKDKDTSWTWKDTGLHTAAALTDKLDGDIARSTEGVTPLGKAADPAADKVFNTGLEIAMAQRGELKATHVGIRFLRDAGISALRAAVSHKTEGNADIGANISGKISTATRLVVNVAAASPLGERYPRLRDRAQTISTLAVIASGAYTAYKLAQKLRNEGTKSASPQ